MKEFIEKLIGGLEEISVSRDNDGVINGCNMGICEDDDCLKCLKKKVISIVNQLAEEYKQDIDTIDVSELFGNSEQVNDGWISVEDRLPEETECYFVTWRDRATCKNYVEITEYDAGSQEWLDCICQAGLLGYDIIAWKPLPEPYQPKGE